MRAFDGGYSRLILLVFLPHSLESAIQENGSKTLGLSPCPSLDPSIPHSELLCPLIWALSGPAAAVATPARCSTEGGRAEPWLLLPRREQGAGSRALSARRYEGEGEGEGFSSATLGTLLDPPFPQL